MSSYYWCVSTTMFQVYSNVKDLISKCVKDAFDRVWYTPTVIQNLNVTTA